MMKRAFRALVTGLLVAACSGTVEQFPPPETTSGTGGEAISGSGGSTTGGCMMLSSSCVTVDGGACPPEGAVLFSIDTASGCHQDILSDGKPPKDGFCCGPVCLDKDAGSCVP
ncbi:MAG: hypothetical protein QM820_13180 [Minicystis sp.]